MIQPPNLPLAPKGYESRYQDQFARVLTLFFNRLVALGPLQGTSLTLTDLAGATALGANVNDTQTTILLADTAKFPVVGSGTIIGTTAIEKISWTGKTATELLGVTRGILGTTPIAHNHHDIVVASATPGAVYANPTTNALFVVV